MGMSIDKAIPKIQFVRNVLNDDMEIAKAYDLAIETMRKYQKIEQIRNRVKYTDLEPAKAYELINEVVVDGKID